MQKLPIGVYDFREIIEGGYYYIDKTLLIKELLDHGAKVSLIPRPRRFGKTLNVSMLRYFFEKCNDSKAHLFQGLAIERVGLEYLQHQNRYPVILLTFKDVRERNWDDAYQMIKKMIAEEYKRHRYLATSSVLDDFESKVFEKIIRLDADYVFYKEALKDLSKYLQRYYQEKVIILIDEYDAPIQNGYMNGFYNEVVEFIRGFLSGGLKDNPALEKGVLTGILRVAKESIFSGLNNLSVYSVLNEKYNKYFGLLTDEVQTFLADYNLLDRLDIVTQWYDGYRFGKEVIYNPWSLVKYIESDGTPSPYWVNTSSNDLVRQLITQAGASFKKDLELLLAGIPVRQQVYEDITFHEIEAFPQAIWSFLLFSGYLRAEKQELEHGRLYCALQIPNMEVKYIYEEIIRGWFRDTMYDEKLHLMLASLKTGDIETFEEIFQEFVLNSISMFDIADDEPEKVYHAFVLGMLIYLHHEYELTSNRESGLGRYDIMLVPRAVENRGIIIEFKKVSTRKKETLESAAQRALEQIEQKRYRQALLDRGIQEVLELGIAFAGKEVYVAKRGEGNT